MDPLPTMTLISADPTPTAVTTPREPVAFDTVATLGSLLDHVSVGSSVRSRGGPAPGVPVALNDRVAPTASVAGSGVMSIRVGVAPLTVTLVLPATPLSVAVIATGPPAQAPVTSPVPDTDTIPGIALVHVARAEMFAEVPSVYVAVAVS
jgi:hypothetical protein